ncbi:DNA mismatch repair protein MutS [Blattabacterium cuenoti]|uniref:DNA mismatch repair protein MutS n=1 Tax=Blattabacterium cuenoti TaxID=1653831 RepID=UPI00163CA00C|nr:DNA mismatch repair protein MutS [Blattabacterium cuenoti]
MNKKYFCRKKEDTPLIKQYNDIKSKYPGTILLFQVGDFYEIFGKDAIICSNILNIVLTKRLNNINLAGFPCHSLNTHLPKIVNSGFRVAICNQLEISQKKEKNIIKRGIVEIITPGVTINESIIKTKENNFLISIYIEYKRIGVSMLDISTGEFFTTEDYKNNLLQYIKHFNPSEILIQKKEKEFFYKLLKNKYYTFLIEDWIFDYLFSYEKLTSHFKTNSLKGFGINDLKLGIISSGVILYYLHDNHHFKIKHISNIHRINKEEYIWIDDYTFKNLEIFKPFNKEGISLLDVLDNTSTTMGSRLLKNWILFPSLKISIIEKRHKIIEELCYDNTLRNFIKENLKKICDIERITAKIAMEKISPREIYTLHRTILLTEEIKNNIISKKIKNNITLIAKSILDCKYISEKIVNIIQENPPFQIEKGKGNVIKSGISKDLDEIRALYFSQKEHLEKLCYTEKSNTKISNLKIGYNNIFGYYFEIKKREENKVPNYWIRKQSLSNSNKIRYVTETLKNYELKILNAEQKIFSMEKEIFHKLIQYLIKNIKELQINSKIFAELDVLCTFSFIALENNYTKPEMNNSGKISILDGRHPVIEKKFISKSSYIPNDVFLDKKSQQIIIITGPNMSGKSAVLRQTAIIILMAHVGCFIPAKSAKIGLVDKIFSRIGAYDNISIGESTFMVEMNETANILNNITEKSFIILDEVGRGTSTNDGVSISKAIIEFLHKHKFRPLTLFATHYHELKEISFSLKRVKNFQVYVKKINDDIIFMYKLILGNNKNSFGINVAKMAGIPMEIIYRAKEILKILEKNEKNHYEDEYIFFLKKLIFYLKKIEKISYSLTNINKIN